MKRQSKKVQELRARQDPMLLEEVEDIEDHSESSESIEEDKLNPEIDQKLQIKLEKLRKTSDLLTSNILPDYISSDTIQNVQIDKLKNTLKPSRPKAKDLECFDDENITEYYQSKFSDWFDFLLSGFNLLLYGPGSKINLLESYFDFLTREGCTCVKAYAYIPSFTLRKLLSDICSFCGVSSEPDIESSIQAIHKSLSKKNTDIFLLLHNIEGSSLPYTDMQESLSKLAANDSVHLIATLDNPYLVYRWSQDTSLRFNFLYLCTPTYANYTSELSFDENLNVFGKALSHSQVRGTKFVLKSITKDQRAILLQLAHAQLKQGQGITLQDLFNLCTDAMLVTSQKQLKDSLTEAKDHQIVVYRTGTRGETLLQLKIDPKFLIDLIKEEFNES